MQVTVKEVGKTPERPTYNWEYISHNPGVYQSVTHDVFLFVCYESTKVFQVCATNGRKIWSLESVGAYWPTSDALFHKYSGKLVLELEN